MGIKLLFTIFMLLAITYSSLADIQRRPDAYTTLERMLEHIENVEGLKFKLRSWERLDDEMSYNEIIGKLNVRPTKIYIYSVSSPNKGAEVLYVEGERNGRALVNPNSFPYVNVNLNPLGNQMRSDQHHTIFNTGFEFLAGIIRHAKESRLDGQSPDEFLEIEHNVFFANRLTHKVTIIDPDFTYVDYTIQNGESLKDIADRKFICEYLIVEKNGFRNFNSGRSGQTIQIPTSYAKKTELYIDIRNYLPIGQFMYDERGLFERYEFYDVEVNPDFADDEFTSSFPDYNF
ncbi:MAG: DUF1571 domain-containing protein [Chitinophagaceae bacterium]|nr:MAG: DUF1571 domain-containing protein [Chitinophagaceae bacterium]